MKTIYPLKSKPRQRNFPRTFIIVVVFLVFTGIVYIFPSQIRVFSYTISLPFWSVKESISKSFSKVGGYFSFKNSLIDQNLSLENEISSLRLKVIDYDLLLKENQDLKNQFGRTNNTNRVLAKVLSKPPRSPYDTFIIDIGSNEGITPGSKVYISDTIIVGIVKNVTPKTSLVELFSSGKVKQDAVLSRTGSTFQLLGRGGANFTIEVPKDTDIIWGDTLAYPTFSTSVIGSVYYIDSNTQSAFKTVYVKIPGNAFSTNFVQVEK